MRKIKVLLQKYEQKHLTILMEIEFMEKHNYEVEILVKKREQKIIQDIVTEIRACLNGGDKE